MAWKAPQMLSPPVHHLLEFSTFHWQPGQRMTPNDTYILIAVLWYDISYWCYIQFIHKYIYIYIYLYLFTHDIPCYLLVSIVMMYRYFIAFQSARLPFSMHYLLLYHRNQSLCDGSLSLCYLYSFVHSLKLTAFSHPKMDAWKDWYPFQVLPSRELTYPPKIVFWRWFSHSQGGICIHPLEGNVSFREGLGLICFPSKNASTSEASKNCPYGRGNRVPYPGIKGRWKWSTLIPLW